MDFLAAAVDHKRLITTENIAKAFALFDTNKDGSIDVEDFKVALPKPNMGTLTNSASVGKAPQLKRHDSITQSVLDVQNENVDQHEQFEKDNEKWLAIIKPYGTKDDKVTLSEFTTAIELLITQTYAYEEWTDLENLEDV